MKTLFISDIHLDDDLKLWPLFDYFIKTIAPGAEKLYILGDLFAAWIGSDASSILYLKVTQALSELALSGTKIYFCPGNRDFLLEKNFYIASQCERLDDHTLIDLYGIPTLIAHGDTFCLSDKAYQRFRKITRLPWLDKLFLHLPLSFKEKIALSLKRKPSLPQKIIDIDLEHTLRLAKKMGAKQIIHGHTHLHTLSLDKESGIMRYVLSDWGKKGQYFLFSDQKPMESLFFSNYTFQK